MRYQLNEHPLVSVIVPAYNAEEYLGTTLRSLICQSYPHLEIIVVDDGSDDQTPTIVKNFVKIDNRIQLLQQSHTGVAAARNLAVRHSKGCFIAPVDADDICRPNKFLKLVTALHLASDDFGLAYSWSYIIDQNDNIIGKGTESIREGYVYLPYLFSNFIGNASATLIRKKCFETVGLFDQSFFYQKAQGCEDYDLFLRIAEQFKFKVVKEYLTAYRKSPNSMSCLHKTMEKSHSLVFKAQKAKNPWIPDVIFKWSCAYYYLWLSGLAANNRAYHDSIIFLLKAAMNDPNIFKTSDYFIIFLARIFKWIYADNLNANNENKNISAKHQSSTNRKINSAKNWLKKLISHQKKSRLITQKEKRLATANRLFKQSLMKSRHYNLINNGLGDHGLHDIR